MDTEGTRLTLLPLMIFAAQLARMKTRRAGIIPYPLINEEIWFLLAQHRETKEFGDFGGGVRKTEFALEGAVREFGEETSGVFGDLQLTLNDLSCSLAVVDAKQYMTVIFMYLDPMWFEKVRLNFDGSQCAEISSVAWVHEKAFQQMVAVGTYRRNVMWSKVQSFFQKILSPDFLDALKLMRF